MNFQISWPLNSPDLNSVDYKMSGNESTRKKAQDVNYLRWHIIDVRVGVLHSVTDDGIHQWRRRLHACIRAMTL